MPKMNIKRAALNLKVKEANADLFQIRAVFSTGDVDRHGEVVDQKGWDLTEFMMNPVVLWSHDSWQPAIGKVVDLGFVNGNLEGTLQFAAKEYEFAKVIYNLMAGGYINAISVGFDNLEFKFDEVSELVTLTKNKLMEVSVVNIPANALALAKEKGIDLSVLDRKSTRAKSFNEKILGNAEEGAEDGEQEDVEDEKKPEEAVEAEAPADKDTEPAVPAPAASVDEATKAIETLTRADNGTINAAVKALQSHLDAAKPNHQRSNVGGKKYSVTQLNRVVKRLIKAKS